MDKKKAAAGDASTGESRFSKMVKVADVILKLTPALATGLAAWVAYDFQARSAGVSLLNQREQAETQLRASMFNNLIGPIAGPIKDKPLSADQQRILVELLMLNFHEHVEFKPLLLNADKRLAAEHKGQQGVDAARKSLRSVVRRVLDRQLAVLQKDCAAAWASVQAKRGAVFSNATDMTITCQEEPETISFCESTPAKIAQNMAELWVGGKPCRVISTTSDNLKDVYSPDRKYMLTLGAGTSDWDEQVFSVNVLWSRDKQPVNAVKFDVTRYDLPFTDNTILDRDHRFALVIKDVNENALCATQPTEGDGDLKCKILNLWVVWFPPHYILPHERPINFQEIRKILDLDSASS